MPKPLQVILLTILSALSVSPAVKNMPVPLTSREMMSLRGNHGGTACDQCGTDPRRIDECAHFSADDACRTDQCIENILLEDTCLLSTTSDCSSDLDTNVEAYTQFVRDDDNCQTNNPNQWQIWVTHYYGSSCTSRAHTTRCQKADLSCDGTLLSTMHIYPGIQCN